MTKEVALQAVFAVAGIMAAGAAALFTNWAGQSPPKYDPALLGFLTFCCVGVAGVLGNIANTINPKTLVALARAQFTPKETP